MYICESSSGAGPQHRNFVPWMQKRLHAMESFTFETSASVPRDQHPDVKGCNSRVGLALVVVAPRLTRLQVHVPVLPSYAASLAGGCTELTTLRLAHLAPGTHEGHLSAAFRGLAATLQHMYLGFMRAGGGVPVLLEPGVEAGRRPAFRRAAGVPAAAQPGRALRGTASCQVWGLAAAAARPAEPRPPVARQLPGDQAAGRDLIHP